MRDFEDRGQLNKECSTDCHAGGAVEGLGEGVVIALDIVALLERNNSVRTHGERVGHSSNTDCWTA